MTGDVATLDVDKIITGAVSTSAADRARGCAKPIRLKGASVELDTTTGEVVRTYSSDDELDGHTYVRCGNRRAAVCPSCSREYKGDAWHVIMCGLTGGHGVPDTVTAHPSIFVTLTAPSFGPVHRATNKTSRHGKKSPCRARRDRPVCPHGRALSCTRRHDPEDRFVGQPLCRDCYDYTAHVIWQWHAPELWRRFTIALRRHLARSLGLTVKDFGQLARLSYTKVAEFQARGAVHFHAVVRLDGPEGPDTPPLPGITVDQLTTAVETAASAVYVDAPTPDGDELRLRWGTELDTRTITTGADRENGNAPNRHPAMVGAYLSKYLTKSTEDFGLSTADRIRSATDARHAGATPHAVRLIAAAAQLVTVDQAYRPIARRYGTLGYRGHPITKSRAYGITFGHRRNARRTWRRNKARLAETAPVRDVLDLEPATTADESTVIVIGSWEFAGVGYLDNFTAVSAVEAANQARSR